MTPTTGTLLRRYVGDQISFTLHAPGAPASSRAYLRCNIGCSRQQQQAIIDAVEGRQVQAQTAWQSLPMQREGDHFRCTVTLVEAGSFAAKAYLVDEQEHAHWPAGDNLAILSHPSAQRSGNTIYCAFTRMYGGNKRGAIGDNPVFDQVLQTLDRNGYAVIPPSGKLRDLKQTMPHIVDRLGCRILHLLPVNPTPTTFARYGRYGSPYAALDFTAIDPALIVHDKATTPEEQFRELVDAVHDHDASLFLDLAINHTGWGSALQNQHPEWFIRNADGSFHSPGAWGTVWEDLSELDYAHRELWQYIADCFLVWCRRGVDGFRCDAGYMVPLAAWQYIIAKVHSRFPGVIFLLEGLGGAWETTEQLLTTGGMQWCYSELFQNYDAAAINGYLRYVYQQSEQRGIWVHYSETHDNLRLAADDDGKAWSLFRNRLCALTSVDGAYGFTGGVEWLATEKLLVHGNRSLNWNASEHICDELAAINRLLADHPCFRDGARIDLLSHPGDATVVIHRHDRETDRHVVVVANPDRSRSQQARIPATVARHLGQQVTEISAQRCPEQVHGNDGSITLELPPLTCCCLESADNHQAESGAEYRRRRAVHAWATSLLGSVLRPHQLPICPWRELADLADDDPMAFIAACTHLPAEEPVDLDCLRAAMREETTPRLSQWRQRDTDRVLPLPSHHVLVIRHPSPFRVHLQQGKRVRAHRRSVATRDGHLAIFLPRDLIAVEHLQLHDIASGSDIRGQLQVLDARSLEPSDSPANGQILLCNGRGGMAFMPVIPHAVTSKYNCVLAANLDSQVPCDRHVLIKRLRMWVRVGGFTAPLDENALIEIRQGPPATWLWRCAFAGHRQITLRMQADMLHDSNSLVIRFQPQGRVPKGCELIIRADCEDRSFHAETDLSSTAAVDHFRRHIRPLGTGRGFDFHPAKERRLEVSCDHGRYHHEEECCRGIAHPHEATRGQRDRGDAYSPGWFAIPLEDIEHVHLQATAEPINPTTAEFTRAFADRQHRNAIAIDRCQARDWFGQSLALATQAYVVRRESGHSVIAGYPWFLDWGRDTLICARGLLAAGLHDEVLGILEVFGRFEERGTLPNCIFGNDASNRETSDAPLWYGVVAEDAAERIGNEIYDRPVAGGGRTIATVLRDLACGLIAGTPNGIRVDAESCLVWSPSHFTWMDTNHPAGTPRVGYPVEIQALWIRLLRQLDRLGAAAAPGAEPWSALAVRATDAFNRLFWRAGDRYYSDCLHGDARTPANKAVADNALRSNFLSAIALGIITGPQARLAVTAARDWLIVPGAIRSLAPRPVSPPLPILGPDGRPLGDPEQPYRGHYQGDEDRERKPAYHNGTAWTWPYPVFCEAYARSFDLEPAAITAARSYLSGMQGILNHGCLGQIPEIVDGSGPHTQRGCLAQAWGVTEALRVWRWLDSLDP